MRCLMTRSLRQLRHDRSTFSLDSYHRGKHKAPLYAVGLEDNCTELIACVASGALDTRALDCARSPAMKRSDKTLTPGFLSLPISVIVGCVTCYCGLMKTHTKETSNRTEQRFTEMNVSRYIQREGDTDSWHWQAYKAHKYIVCSFYNSTVNLNGLLNAKDLLQIVE